MRIASARTIVAAAKPPRVVEDRRNVDASTLLVVLRNRIGHLLLNRKRSAAIVYAQLPRRRQTMMDDKSARVRALLEQRDAIDAELAAIFAGPAEPAARRGKPRIYTGNGNGESRSQPHFPAAFSEADSGGAAT
jgi:hypothetical protein